MFADDTKIFRQITSRDDAIDLQEDLRKLEEWSGIWLLKFNADKCHVLTLGKFQDIKHAKKYTLCNHELEHVPTEKDLGVTIDEKLKFDEHITRKKTELLDRLDEVSHTSTPKHLDDFMWHLSVHISNIAKQHGPHTYLDISTHWKMYRFELPNLSMDLATSITLSGLKESTCQRLPSEEEEVT